MPTVRLSADVRRVERQLSDIARKQLPFAVAKAVNDVAFQVQRAERDNLKRVLKNPRPFTQRSVVVEKATKARPTATVKIRPEVARYLAPYEFGGTHELPGKGLLNPKGVRLDQYGQLTRGKVKTLAAQRNVFVGTVQTEKGPVKGFWQRAGGRKGGRLKLLVRFGEALPVTKRLNFRVTAQDAAKRAFPAALRAALDRALATARS